jgi:hypothetical protein
MTIVFDEVEGLIEPRDTGIPSLASSMDSGVQEAAQRLERLLRDLRTEARRAARLRAD